MEIERKFMMDGFPDLPEKSRSLMYQGYLSLEPTVRIRSKENEKGRDYKLCIKGEGTLAREEIELPLEEPVFQRLAGLLKAPMIRKEHRTYALPDGLVLECSLVDEGLPTAFYYAEIEFPTLEAARAFVPPAYLGRDVTEEKQYYMGAYWERTRLQGQ